MCDIFLLSYYKNFNKRSIVKQSMYRFFKRFFDLTVSFSAIVCLAWLLLLLCLLVAMFLGRPVIFKQPRPGKNGKIFMLYKFRSMSNKKDENGNLLPDEQRLSKFGKFLRASSLDELPQLFNILKGDMSLIGPRPRMIEECVFLNEEQCDRFKVRPGITGLAQINGRNNITFDQVVEYDKKYVQNFSFKQDFKIFFKTFGYVLSKKDVAKTGTVSNEFYGDYLLRTKQISKDYYDEKLTIARSMVEVVKNKKFGKKGAKMRKNINVLTSQEDFDLEHKIID